MTSEIADGGHRQPVRRRRRFIVPLNDRWSPELRERVVPGRSDGDPV